MRTLKTKRRIRIQIPLLTVKMELKLKTKTRLITSAQLKLNNLKKKLSQLSYLTKIGRWTQQTRGRSCTEVAIPISETAELAHNGLK